MPKTKISREESPIGVLYSTEEVAAFTGRTRRTAQRWSRAQRLPALMVGGQYMVRREALQAFVKEDSFPPGPYHSQREAREVSGSIHFRRAELASLKVGDFHMNRGYDSLKVVRKSGKKGSLAIHPQMAQRIRDYLEKTDHPEDLEGPLFRPIRGNQRAQDARRHLHPDEVDRILRKYVKRIGLDRGYSAHSMRTTFITTALDNGTSLEDVQRAAGYADPSTTKLYDRRGYNPEKSASFLRIIKRYCGIV
jgi:excisionase family DNA binding protein